MSCRGRRDVVDLYARFERARLRVWIDGGWAVDALLGEQTRAHDDLDLALSVDALDALVALLAERGYVRKGEPGATPWNFVVRDHQGREVDLHAFRRDGKGDGYLGPVENGDFYPAHSLMGTGTILDHEVRCITVEDLIAFHTGYEPDDDDRRDVLALCKRFGITPPAPYATSQEP